MIACFNLCGYALPFYKKSKTFYYGYVEFYEKNLKPA